jgi:hypothetical protein
MESEVVGLNEGFQILDQFDLELFILLNNMWWEVIKVILLNNTWGGVIKVIRPFL